MHHNFNPHVLTKTTVNTLNVTAKNGAIPANQTAQVHSHQPFSVNYSNSHLTQYQTTAYYNHSHTHSINQNLANQQRSHSIPPGLPSSDQNQSRTSNQFGFHKIQNIPNPIALNKSFTNNSNPNLNKRPQSHIGNSNTNGILFYYSPNLFT